MATPTQVAAALQQGALDALGAPAVGTDLGTDQAIAGVLAGLAVDLPSTVAAASQPVVDAINAAAVSIVAAINALGKPPK